MKGLFCSILKEKFNIFIHYQTFLCGDNVKYVFEIAFFGEIQLNDSSYEARVESGHKRCETEMVFRKMINVAFPALRCSTSMSICGELELINFDPVRD